MQVLGSLKIMHVFREQNQVADVLAKVGLRQDTIENTHFLEVPPMSARTHIQADISETTFAIKAYVKISDVSNLLSLGGVSPN